MWMPLPYCCSIVKAGSSNLQLASVFVRNLCRIPICVLGRATLALLHCREKPFIYLTSCTERRIICDPRFFIKSPLFRILAFPLLQRDRSAECWKSFTE